MRNFLKILVAADYSESGINAERYAIQLAKATHSTITFFHVLEVPFFPTKIYTDIEKLSELPGRVEMKELNEHIEELLQSMNLSLDDIDYRCKVGMGNLPEELYTEAERYHADLIVMGTHESAAMETLLMGSHTWDVIKGANIPVLVIPEELSYKNIKHLVFATEYREGELPAIKFLANLARQFDAELTILHIYNDIFSPEFEKDIFERFKTEVKDMVSYGRLSIHLIHNNNLVEGLNSFCISAKANWLVMSHERTLFFINFLNPVSVTKKMSLHTHVPLFAIPDNYTPKDFFELNLQENGHETRKI
jgi:nucleotide-binding universal stress UspA family protein